MKIRSISHNNRKKAFEVKTAGKVLSFPFAKLEIIPNTDDTIVRVFVDKELASEAFTYVLESGAEDSVHIEQVLEYNQDPAYLRELVLYKLTVEVKRRVDKSPLSQREIIRRLGTSATQFYRLLDPTNRRKSIDKLLELLHVLDCDVDLVVRAKSA